MATGDDKVDDLDEPSAEKPKKDKSGMMKIILIAVGLDGAGDGAIDPAAGKE